MRYNMTAEANRGWAFKALCWMITIPLIYLLSFGPVVFLLHQFPRLGASGLSAGLMSAYAGVTRLMEEPAFYPVIRSYVEFWQGLAN